MSLNALWLAFGFLGQAIFGARFLVQWIASERRRESHIPLVFWWLSILGGAVTLAYAIHKKDPVFIIPQVFGLIVYTRNLMLIYRAQRHAETTTSPDRA
ncbi:MAG TPA: lipid-A-disaccharide synthase N-terminal domain-containing protein [Thermoanaerobaculia bacterium]